MNTQILPLPPRGQGKRLVGSLVLPLGVGLVLETSYQWSGIGIILIGILLVMLGWKEHWQH
ncbi:MAG: hypothetical protein HYZ72_01390 [Deltaproteobacteria bacterium]|nr:hypothetical protein [Deltaproteobacteria bacterium]